ncbi:MAG: hypothetical protein M3441_06145 [Chloroflexota bacterium]|nr:hypothetical protein [Chloroflexota bacterium]
MTVIEHKEVGPQVRVWLGEWPQATYDCVAVQTIGFESPGINTERSSKVAIEVLRGRAGHPSSYGLLGGEFLPGNRDQLTAEVCISRSHGAIFKPALISSPVDYAQVGLPDSYVLGVMEGLGGANQILGPGLLRFACAVHGLYGSSHVVFKWLAQMNVRLLARPDDLLTSGELTSIVNSPF